jgi:D-alanine-D-alanine ligase-like ATP-grasp enzyme
MEGSSFIDGVANDLVSDLAAVAGCALECARRSLLAHANDFESALADIRRRRNPSVLVIGFSSDQQSFLTSLLERHAALPSERGPLAVHYLENEIFVEYVRARNYDLFMKERILGEGFSDVVAMVTGNDGVVPLVDFVNERLVAPAANVISNAHGTSSLRQDKFEMQEALRAAGLSYIRSELVESPEDVHRTLKRIGLPAIVKPLAGAGSEFVTFCRSESEVHVALRVGEDSETTQFTPVRMMLQEYIEGDEFVVDTVSCRGVHVVTDVWRSFKVPYECPGSRLRGSVERSLRQAGKVVPSYTTSNLLYDRLEFVADVSDDPFIAQLVDYTLKCLDVLGVVNGCAHSELRADASKGFVLIEMNPRMQGDVPRASRLVGYDQYELLAVLLAALYRDRENGHVVWPPPEVPLRYNRSSALQGITRHVVFLRCAEDGFIAEPGRRFITLLPSFVQFTRASGLAKPEAGMIYCCRRTVDLYSCCGAVILEGTESDVIRDREVIREMQNGVVTKHWMPFLLEAGNARKQYREASARFESLRAQELNGGGKTEHEGRLKMAELDLIEARALAHEMCKIAALAFRDYTPPPLFVSNEEWRAVVEAQCGALLGG